MRYQVNYKVLLFLFLVIQSFVFVAKADENRHPQNYFASPLNIPLTLSGTFGELRGSHFHAGLDFRTQGREGLEVLASAEGYVSRINVSPTGYGKALYITHPNGYVTVYAHLQRFNEDIEKFIREIQFSNRTYSVQLHPKRTMFRFKQGDIIGYSGNTGSSGGPHLHFEIRDASTQEPINPMLFGFDVQDNIPPEIRAVRIHPLSPDVKIRIVREHPAGRTETYINQAVTLKAIGSGKNHRLENISEIHIYGKVGFSIETYDFHEGSQNRLGPPYVSLYKNAKLEYAHALHRFSFNQTRYIQAHIDFQQYFQSRRNFQRSYILPGNRMGIYKTSANSGRIQFDESSNEVMQYVVKDDFGNESRLSFSVKGSSKPESKQAKMDAAFESILYPGKSKSFERNGIKVGFASQSVYDTVYMQYHTSKVADGSFSKLHHLHLASEPVHQFFSLEIKAEGLPHELKERAFIARMDENGNNHYVGGRYDRGFISGRARNFGTYHIIVDTIAPEISPINFRNGSNVRNLSELRIKITDDNSGIASYDAFINGNWVLMAHDPKNDMLILRRRHVEIPEGEFNLQLHVYDRAGNDTMIVFDLRN